MIFLKALLLITILLSVTSPCLSRQQPAAPPNILIIIADDMSPHAGIYGVESVMTPALDRLGKEGIAFDNAFCAAPSCTASRASILTGRHPHQLKESGNLWSTLSTEFPNYTRLLKENGYEVGLTGKGWGPGDYRQGGYSENPAGPDFESFDSFLSQLEDEKPFCFWIGSHDPHRPYDQDLKRTTASDAKKISISPWLPASKVVEADVLDYYAEINRFDKTIEMAIAALQQHGLYENTLIIITSDNGMPFPRSKANLYDGGTRIPLVMRWGNHLSNGRRYQELVSLVDLAPTILNAANIPIPESVTGKSLLPLLMSGEDSDRFKVVFLERERHANVRPDGLGYPMRAIRTHDYLFIVNLRPDRWPAGDPDFARGFGDIDNGPSKTFLVDNMDRPAFQKMAKASLGKRPAEELYDLRRDPNQLENVAGDPAYKKIAKELRRRLSEWRRQTNDPVTESGIDVFDTYPYYGGKRAK